MSETLVQLTQMTLATTHTTEMVKFYDTLLAQNFNQPKRMELFCTTAIWLAFRW